MPQKGVERIQTQTPKPNGDEMSSTQEAELLNSLLEQSRNLFVFHEKNCFYNREFREPYFINSRFF